MTRRRRAGFSATEIMTALTLFAIVIAMAAQLAGFVTKERARTAARHDALEQCDNVLERARALPWRQLTPEWADQQKLHSDHMLPEGSLKVEVTTLKDEPHLKKVQATVRWKLEAENDVSMSAWIRDRGEEQP